MTPGINRQASVLLFKASEDEAVLKHADIPDAPFGFHIQQSIEKHLKALLCQRKVNFRFTHDLDQLAAMLTDVGETLPDCCADFSLLGEFAVTHRYEDIPEFHVLNRDQALETVRRIREFVRGRIGELSGAALT